MFEIRSRASTVGREVLGGLTTFMAMSYILFVQPAVLSKAGMDPGGVFMATCIASAAACILMGLLANYPIALAPGMGENFFFVFTLCGVGAAAAAFKLTWQEALALTAVVGVLFLALSVVGFRSMIVNAIPDALKSGIAAGIGLFIALIGFEWGNLICHDPVTCVKIAPMAGNYVALLTLLGLGITLALAAFHVRGAVLIGILAGTALTWGAGALSIRPELGLTVEPAEHGVEVAAVRPNSAAELGGGIQPGDRIVAYNWAEIHSQKDYAAAVASAEGMDEVDVEVVRRGERLGVSMPLVLRTIELTGVVGKPRGLGATAGGMF
ncbi:MAG TPA: solute carrier family 23 protein, partial [Phycisphaerae bacterium]|nr:solute carrier family 23 protein [Phycisphaerae bacterium]